MINYSLTKLARSTWLDVGLGLFLDLRFVLFSREKKNLANSQPLRLTVKALSITHVIQVGIVARCPFNPRLELRLEKKIKRAHKLSVTVGLS